MSVKLKHGFTAVDKQEDPTEWVAVLDKLAAEPFYATYKRRCLELLEPRQGGRYLDVGAGTGEDAYAIASSANCTVIGIDRSLTMAKVCHRRSLIPASVCEAAELPFCDEIFDGARADRTFQHLLDPGRALGEIIRVSKSGARLLTVDPDYDTQVMEFSDQALARKIFRYRADYQLQNGTISHQMPGMFHDAGLASIRVESLTLSVRDPAAVDNVMGLRTWARTAAAHQYIGPEEANRWEQLFDQTVRDEKFFYAVTFFITVGVKP
jgi:ubiquinone/menaquinone biosynthesis C-methylase UbiE